MPSDQTCPTCGIDEWHPGAPIDCIRALKIRIDALEETRGQPAT